MLKLSLHFYRIKRFAFFCILMGLNSTGFQPTNICALRVMESDGICGLDSQKAEDLRHYNVRLLVSGRFGVIQFAEGNECGCGLD